MPENDNSQARGHKLIDMGARSAFLSLARSRLPAPSGKQEQELITVFSDMWDKDISEGKVEVHRSWDYFCEHVPSKGPTLNEILRITMSAVWACLVITTVVKVLFFL